MSDTTNAEFVPMMFHPDGLPPIRAKVEKVADGETRTINSTRWVEVYIYKTKGGKFIAHVKRVSLWDGEKTREEVTVCEDAVAVVEALGGGGETFGEASIEALNKAAKGLPEFAAVWIKDVE